MRSFNTPILLLIFNRPETTQKVFESIRNTKPSKLFVAADGPRADKPGEYEKCMNARAIVDQINWDCEVKTLFTEENLGCGRAVSGAITWFFKNVEEGIILEDDCLPNQSYYKFCEELLHYYRENPKVAQISGDNYQFGRKVGDSSYYFSAYNHIWGWATWRRSWQNFDYDMTNLDNLLKSKFFKSILRSKEERNFWEKTFKETKENDVNVWGYRWTYSVWNSNGLTVLPSKNLVSNIGFDADATHTTGKSKFDHMETFPLDFPLIHPKKISVNKDADRYTSINNFGIKINGHSNIRTVIKAFLNKLWKAL